MISLTSSLTLKIMKMEDTPMAMKTKGEGDTIMA
jgi:hypothetical protein